MSKAAAHQALCRAIGAGALAQVRAALRGHAAGATHWKPIMDAAFLGRADIVQMLLDAGASPNVVAGTGARHTPLTRLAQHHRTIAKHPGHAETLRVLLAAGANPATPAGPHGMVPLAYAAMGPELPLVEVLREVQRRPSIHLAAALLDEGSLHRALRHAPAASEADGRGRTPLHYVALSGLWKTRGAEAAGRCAELLLAAGAGVDDAELIPEGPEVFRATPLWRTLAWQGNLALAELLLKAGAAPDPAVFAVTYGGDERACALLARFRPDWDVRVQGRTPLMDLMHFRRPAGAAFLLAQGVDVNATDPQGMTALHFAALRGVRADHVRRLLRAGARPDAKDAAGKTPFDHARSKGHEKLMALLRPAQGRR